MIEQWRTITEYENTYRVSNLGRVHGPTKILKPLVNKGGYLVVQIRTNGKHRNKLVHRLIAKAFIPNPLNKPYVNHIDNDRANNSLKNLEWCTPAENTKHSNKQLRHAFGERLNFAKLTAEQVTEIRDKAAQKLYSYRELGEQYGVHKSTIYKIVSRHNWRYN